MSLIWLCIKPINVSIEWSLSCGVHLSFFSDLNICSSRFVIFCYSTALTVYSLLFFLYSIIHYLLQQFILRDLKPVAYLVLH